MEKRYDIFDGQKFFEHVGKRYNRIEDVSNIVSSLKMDEKGRHYKQQRRLENEQKRNA